MISFICEQEISVWYSVPLALQRMMESGSFGRLKKSNLRTVLFAGEAFPTAELATLRGISRHCADCLPMHMVPTRIHVLDAFPSTSNGKLDRDELTRVCEKV